MHRRYNSCEPMPPPPKGRPLAATPHMPSPRGRHGRPDPGRSGGDALPSAESSSGGGGAPSCAGGAASGSPPCLAKAVVETPPRAVEVGPYFTLRQPVSRPSGLVGPGGGMVAGLLSRHRNRPPVIPPVSSRGISSERSLSRGHPGWGAWKTSACSEEPASSLVDVLLVVV